MGVGLIIIARTDALSAKLLDNNIDPLDHPYIQGECEDGQVRTIPEEGVNQIKRIFGESSES